jgi:hypothetical protein
VIANLHSDVDYASAAFCRDIRLLIRNQRPGCSK